MAAIVYLVTNRLNGKRYVGATGRGLLARQRHHECDAARGADTSPRFHQAIRKYGIESFDWAALREFPDFDSALAEERRMIAEIRPEYNISEGGRGSSGTKRTAEQRERMGAARRGKPFSDEHRRNLSRALTGKKQSAETIAKCSALRLGRPLSEKHRQSIRASLKGRKRPPDVVAKMLATRAMTFAARRAEALA